MNRTTQQVAAQLDQASTFAEKAADLSYDQVDITEAHDRIDDLAEAVRCLIVALKDITAFSTGHFCGEPGCKICAAFQAISKAETGQ